MLNIILANTVVGEAEDSESLDMIILAFTITTKTGKAQEKQLFFLRKAGSRKNYALSYSVLFTREDAFSIFNCFQCAAMSQQQISWHT